MTIFHNSLRTITTNRSGCPLLAFIASWEGVQLEGSQLGQADLQLELASAVAVGEEAGSCLGLLGQVLHPLRS
jgi:hypothetical protein